MDPVLGIAGLIIADQIADHLCLRGLCGLRRLLEKGIRLRQILGIEPRRYAMVRRSRAINLFHQVAIDLRQARIQRVVFGKSLQVSQGDAEIEIVRAGLEDVETSARALGGDQRRLKFGSNNDGFSSSISFKNAASVNARAP